MKNLLDDWNEFVESKDVSILKGLLSEDVKFHSPFVWTPKHGKPITIAILESVMTVFENFRYVRQIVDKNHWVLEFEGQVGNLSLRGVDIIELNEDGKIIEFEVMIRPANALQAVGVEMSKLLQAKGMI